MPLPNRNQLARLRAQAVRVNRREVAEGLIVTLKNGPKWSGDPELGLVWAAIRIAEQPWSLTVI